MLEGGNTVLSRDWSEDKDVTLKRLVLSLARLSRSGGRHRFWLRLLSAQGDRGSDVPSPHEGSLAPDRRGFCLFPAREPQPGSLHYLLWIAPHPDTPPNASLEERRALVYGSMRSHQRVRDKALLDAGWEALRSIGPLLTAPALGYASGPVTGSSPLGPPGGRLRTILPEMMPEEGESGSPGSASRAPTPTASARASPMATKG